MPARACAAGRKTASGYEKKNHKIDREHDGHAEPLVDYTASQSHPDLSTIIFTEGAQI